MNGTLGLAPRSSLSKVGDLGLPSDTGPDMIG